MLERIQVEVLQANISVKLSRLGVELDTDLCRANLESLLGDARSRGNFVRIDMEDATTTDRDDELFRANFLRCLEALLDQGSYVGIATHDEYLIGEGLRIVRERTLTPEPYEFQMLLGVRPQRSAELVRAGHRLRAYVPFGTNWYAYSLRRL